VETLAQRINRMGPEIPCQQPAGRANKANQQHDDASERLLRRRDRRIVLASPRCVSHDGELGAFA